MIAHLRDRNLRILAFSLLLWLVGLSAYDPLLAIHARNLGASPEEVGYLFASGLVVVAAGYLIGGVLSDRYPRREVMWVSWFAGAAAPAVYYLAPSWPWLFAGLAVYNLSYFGLPAINAYVAASVKPRALASAFALIGAASALGAVAGAPIGGLVADRFGIRAAFALGLALFLLSSLWILGLAPDGAPRAAPREAMAVRPVVRYIPLVLFVSSAGVVPFLAAPFVSPYLKEVGGLSLTQIGALASISSFAGLVLAPLFGRLGDAVGRPAAMSWALLVEGAGHALLVLGPRSALPLAFALRARSPARALSDAWVGEAVPAHLSGRAFGLSGTMGSLLAAAAAALGGIAYGANPTLPFLAVAAIAVVLAAGARVARRRTPRA